jgi:hypothetical protein
MRRFGEHAEWSSLATWVRWELTMKRFMAAAAFLALATAAAAAQSGPPQGYVPPPPQQQQALPPEGVPLKTHAKAPPTKEEILRDAAALTKSIGLPCEVTDAVLINEGTATINDKPIHVRNFEAACSNGMGYFLVEQPPEPGTSFSCFVADATRAVDLAAKREPQPACSLPTNADTKKIAAAVLSHLGQQCQVTGIRLIGHDTKANTELLEAACTGGAGFVITSPLPGSTQALAALNCPDSYRRNIPCKLSSNGAPILTLDTFKEVLAQHKVACTVQEVRSIGRENVKKRHVVEFKCPEQPGGLVAFIPLEETSAPFETMDCASAGSKAHVICTLNQVH